MVAGHRAVGITFLLYASRKNYCFEAFNLLCQYHYDLPPLQAEQLACSSKALGTLHKML